MSQATCSWSQPDVWPHLARSGIPSKPPGEVQSGGSLIPTSGFFPPPVLSVFPPAPLRDTQEPPLLFGYRAQHPGAPTQTHPGHLRPPKLQFHLRHTTGSSSSPLATFGMQDTSASILRIPTPPWEQLSLTQPALNLTPRRVMWKSKDVQSPHPPFYCDQRVPSFLCFRWSGKGPFLYLFPTPSLQLYAQTAKLCPCNVKHCFVNE